MIGVLVALLEVCWLLSMGTYLVLQRRSSTATLAWMLALAFLPFVGVPVYFFLGPRRLRRRKLRRTLARQVVAAARKGPEEEDSAAIVPASFRTLVTLVRETCGCPLTTVREPVLHLDGDACYDAMEAAIARARHHVHMEVYIWEPDRTGRRLLGALAGRAREGVEVRLLLDSVGSKRVTRRFLAPLREAGGEVEWFNPLRLGRFRPRTVNFRSHRKILVCDGREGFVGGMNVADVHAPAVRGPEAWRDTHLGFAGAAVRELQLAFLEDWMFATDQAPLSPDYLEPDPEPGEVPAQVVSSGPDQDHHAVHRLFVAAMGSARERIWATTPYLVPDEAVLAVLTTAALRGLDVRVLLPRRSDLRIVAAAGRSYFDELTGAGVRIFEYGPPMVHAKTLVVDRDLAVVGTANLDNRSFRLNFEIAAVLYGPRIAGELAGAFEEDLNRAAEVVSRDPAGGPFGRRLAEATARLFAPVL